jgi:hypothetical protein
MSQPETEFDPVTEILWLAFLRGRAIQQEQEEKNKLIDLQPLEAETAEEREHNPPEHTLA